MSQLSHAQFPLRRHPNLLVDHRRSRSAAVAEPRGANGEAVTGSGGRLHFGMVAGIKSESPAGLPRNSHLEPVEAVPAIAHDLAGLADVAELFGQFEQARLG